MPQCDLSHVVEQPPLRHCVQQPELSHCVEQPPLREVVCPPQVPAGALRINGQPLLVSGAYLWVTDA